METRQSMPFYKVIKNLNFSGKAFLLSVSILFTSPMTVLLMSWHVLQKEWRLRIQQPY